MTAVVTLTAAVRDLVSLASRVDHLPDDVRSRVVGRLNEAEVQVAWLVDQLAGHPTPHLAAVSDEDARLLVHFLATQLVGVRRIVGLLPAGDPLARLVAESVGAPCHLVFVAAFESTSVEVTSSPIPQK